MVGDLAEPLLDDGGVLGLLVGNFNFDRGAEAFGGMLLLPWHLPGVGDGEFHGMISFVHRGDESECPRRLATWAQVHGRGRAGRSIRQAPPRLFVLWIAALILSLASCGEDRGAPTDPFLADLQRRCERLKPHVERETAGPLGKVEILVLSQEEVGEVVYPWIRARLAQVKNGPEGEALDAEARAAADGAASWHKAIVDQRGRIIFPDPTEEGGLLALLLQIARSEVDEDPRKLDLILLHELIHVHQHRHLESPAFYESIGSRADILARRAVLEGHAEYLTRKIAPKLGLAELYETWFRDRFEPPARIKLGFMRMDCRITAADLGYAYVQGREFVAAMVEKLGEKEAIRRIFKDPPSLAAISRPEEFLRPRERPPWGPIVEDLRRWLVRERGEADLEVIALPMVREIAGDAAREFREGYRLNADSTDVVIQLLIAESEAGAQALHRGWTRGLERLNALKLEAEWFGDLRETRRPDSWTAEAFQPSLERESRRTVVRRGRLVLDVQCKPDSALEQSAERLARRALRFLRSPEWRETWLRGDKDLLKNEDAGLRIAAVSRMGTYVADEDWEVRWLGRFHEARDETKSEEERTAALVGAIEDRHPAVVTRGLRAATTMLLREIGWPLLSKQLGRTEAPVRREAWGLMDMYYDVPAADVKKLVAAALDDEDVVVRVRAAECLKGLSGEPELVAVFRKALSDDHKCVRQSALITLSVYAFDLPELVPDLLRLLGEDPANAAEALGELGQAAEEALPRLHELLDDPDARREAAEAIWQISWDTAPLFDLVRESVAEGSPRGIAALGEVGASGREMVPVVAKVLAHKNRWVRMTAAEALGKIGGKRAREALSKHLEVERDEKVLKSVREALEKLDDQGAE